MSLTGNTPVLDDAMTRTLGNVRYASTRDNEARRIAENEFSMLAHTNTYPYYDAVPAVVGGRLYSMAKKLAKRKSKLRKMKGKKFDKQSYTMRMQHKLAGYGPGAMPFYQARKAAMNKKYKAMKRACGGAMSARGLQARGLEARGMTPVERATYSARKASLIKKLANMDEYRMRSYYKSLKAKSRNYAGTMNDKKARRLMKKLRRTRKYLIQSGYKTGKTVAAIPVGGAVGLTTALVSSLAVPLIKEGITFLARKISERAARRRGQQPSGGAFGLASIARIMNFMRAHNATIPDGKHVWHRTYKLAKAIIPKMIEEYSGELDSDTKDAIKAFMKLHARQMFGVERPGLIRLASDAYSRSSPTIADLVYPLIVASADECRAPTEALHAFMALPHMSSPAGEGLMEDLIGIAKSPEVKQAATSGLKALATIVKDKATRFITSRARKYTATNVGKKNPYKIGAAVSVPPKTSVKAAVADSTIVPDADIVDSTTTTSTESAPVVEGTPAGNGVTTDIAVPVFKSSPKYAGPTTTDMYRSRRLYGVESMAKKMP